MQHMGNSWQVAENGDFEQVDELTAGAQLIKRTLDGWLDTVSQEQRERAIDQIYGIFAAAGYGNIADLVEHWTDSLPKIVEAARNTDRETRGLIRAVYQGDSGQRGEGGARGLKRVECRGGLKRVPRRGYGRMQRLVGMVAEPHFGRFMCHDPSKRREKWNCDT